MNSDDLKALGAALKEQIDANSAEDAKEEQDYRWHLGISIIGQDCLRAVWYDYRWFTPRQVAGRLARLFQRGHDEEKKIVALLHRNGCHVRDRNPVNGRQWLYSAVNGHYGGSCDGLLNRGKPGTLQEPMYLLEMKTHNTQSFVNLVNKASVADAKWQHYVQMCGYGYGMKLEYGLYFAVNKNDDAIYTEFVKLDWTLAQRMEMRAESIITSREPPAKISNKATDYRCKMCDHFDTCHGNVKPPVHCRSCAHSQPTNGGEWWCGVYAAVIPRDVVRKSCGVHYKRID